MTTPCPPLPYEATPPVPKGAAKLLPSRETRGRPEGALPGHNGRLSKGLKESILDAAERVGRDGKGEGGLAGYLEMVALSDVKSFCALLAKVLPMQVTGADGNALAVTFKTVYETKPPSAAGLLPLSAIGPLIGGVSAAA